jgi:hypothetical protein
MTDQLIGECGTHPGQRMVGCSMCAIEAITNAPSPGEIDSLLCDVAQLIDGWKADGTAWTQWDQSIRDRVTALRSRLLTAK